MCIFILFWLFSCQSVLLRLSYLSKNGGVFTSVAKGIDVPGNSRTTTDSKGLVEEPQAFGHLVDDGAVVGGGLVTHTPAAVHKLEPAWKVRCSVKTTQTRSQLNQSCGSRTFVNQLCDRLLHAGALLLPPAVEEGRLNVDEPPVWILQQLVHHRVQDVLNTGMLDVVAI